MAKKNEKAGVTRNCLTCRWEPDWGRSKGFSGVRIGDCKITAPVWVDEAFEVVTGMQCNADNFRTVSKDKDGNTAASLGRGFTDCPTWEKK